MESYLQGTYRFKQVWVHLDARLVRNPVEFLIQIGGIRGSASLPELRPGAFGRPRLVTPPLIRRGKTVGWSDGRGPSTIWGHTAGYERMDEVAGVAVAMLAMRFPLPDDRAASATQVADRLFKSIGPWSKRLEGWLEVVLDEIPTEPLPLPLNMGRTVEKVHGLELQRVDKAGTTSRLLARQQPSTVTGRVIGTLEERVWWRLLDRVNTGVDPPSERMLLRDARDQLEGGHSRRAVLDAATAAEIGLTRMLDKKLEDLPRPVGDLIRHEARQLGSLVRTLQRLGVELPSSLHKDLAEVRNQVIHAGHQPSIAMARRTFLLARDLVEQASPINSLLLESGDRADNQGLHE